MNIWEHLFLTPCTLDIHASRNARTHRHTHLYTADSCLSVQYTFDTSISWGCHWCLMGIFHQCHALGRHLQTVNMCTVTHEIIWLDSQGIPVSSACAREMKWTLMSKSNIFPVTLRPHVWGIPKTQLSPSRIHTLSPPPPPWASLGIVEGKSLRPMIVEPSSGSGLCFQQFSIHKILCGFRVHDCVQLHTRVLFLFLPIFVPKQRLLHSSPAVPLSSPAASQLCMHAQGKPGIRVGKCDFQGVVKRPEESKAAQQQQKLKDRTNEREESSKLTTSAVWNSQMGVCVQKPGDEWQRWSQQQKKKIMMTTMVR